MVGISSYPHDDRFMVRFVYDITNKPSNERMEMDEVGLFTVVDGKITREEFFYPTFGPSGLRRSSRFESAPRNWRSWHTNTIVRRW